MVQLARVEGTNRVLGWEEILTEKVEINRDKPFVWGVTDCLTFPLEVASAITGRDYIREYNLAYNDELTANEFMRRRKWKSVADGFLEQFEEIHPSQAGRGDIAVIERSGQVSGGVFIGARVAARAFRGLGYVPRSWVTRAFKV